MPLTDRNSKLLEKMNQIYAQNCLPQLSVRTCPIGSDAAYITEAEIPCVDNLGVDGGNIHSLNE